MESPQPIPWREFFDRHAPRYDENVFTKNTKVEVQFLVDVMKLEPGMRLLDVGCGTGRHAVELASLGLKVTGVDFSSGMLDQARQKADDRGVDVEWVNADVTQWARVGSFDAAICLCEGGFGLADLDADPVRHDLNLLTNVGASLTSGAPFVMTGMNGLAPLRRLTDEHVTQGSFDPATMTLHHLDTLELPEGQVVMPLKERLWTPPEVVALLFHAGFHEVSVWGGTAGEWGQRPLRLDEIEAMYSCRRR